MATYTCSFPGCFLVTSSHRCDKHVGFTDARYECLFCKGMFDSLPWYGCCGGCYSRSAIVRVLVDASTPQTKHGQEPYASGVRSGVDYAPRMVSVVR